MKIVAKLLMSITFISNVFGVEDDYDVAKKYFEESFWNRLEYTIFYHLGWTDKIEQKLNLVYFNIHTVGRKYLLIDGWGLTFFLLFLSSIFITYFILKRWFR
ncbi:hypothetical protein CFT12S00416_08915, partial [Campylobacter fetus subsp. testudinum]|uniref:hypothetical protein n=1 Tax=Campylobacter fetus TaxID=196 RepID=UPI00081F67A6